MTLAELEARFPDDDACKQELVNRRWPNGVRCPKCDTAKVTKIARPWSWICRACDKRGYRFSPTVGTVFENTNIKLVLWFKAMYFMAHSKKGISALQLQGMLGLKKYESAWYLCHRIRAAMQNDEFKKLAGTVEMDETYIGGKERNKHRSKRLKVGGGHAGKIGVIGAISRKGNVTARVIEKMDYRTAQRFVRDTLADNVSLVATDQHQTYKFMYFGKNAKHETVNHSKGEYVRGQVHTANLDAFWSLLKRGIMGTFHNVSQTYLPLYVNEFAFRHNHRKDADIFGALLAGC
jgi:ribosomal protein L19E